MSGRALDAVSVNFEMDRPALQLARVCVCVRFCADLSIPDMMKPHLSSLPRRPFQQGAARTNNIKSFQTILISNSDVNPLSERF